VPAATKTKKKRKWVGLVCPVCRFVFRIPKEHDGAGVICPACHYLLNIPKGDGGGATHRSEKRSAQKLIRTEPREEKESKPIVSRPLMVSDTLPMEPGETVQKKRRSHRKQKSSQATPDWESQRESTHSESGGDSLMWVVGGSLLGLTIVGIVVWLVLGSTRSESTDAESAGNTASAVKASPVLLTEDEMTPEEKKRQKEIADSVKTGMNVMAKTEKIIKKFLTAKTAAELEPLVRNPEVSIPRMRAWYKIHPWTPPGVKKIACGGKVRINGTIVSMAVRLNDYSIKRIILEKTPSGYLIDWESWVAWSSMDWDTLFEKRPTEPVEVRVRCIRDHYYNRLFKDDSKWVAVRLVSPNSDRSLYGYIDKEDPSLMRMLAEFRGGRAIAAILKIKYPENSVSKNQVIICEYIQNGWVIPSKEKDADEKKEEKP